MYPFSQLVRLEQIRPGEWDFSRANPGSWVYPRSVSSNCSGPGMGRSDSVNKNRRAAARHGRTDAGQASEVQGLVSPSYMQPFAIACRTTRDPTYVRGNLSRKGDLSLHLVSQSEYSSALFIIHGGLGIQSWPAAAWGGGQAVKAPASVVFTSSPLGPAQEGVVPTSLHTLSSQSCWLVRWRP